MRRTSEIAGAWRDVIHGKLTPRVQRHYPVQVALSHRYAQKRRLKPQTAFAELAKAARDPRAPDELRRAFLPGPPVRAIIHATDERMGSWSQQDRETLGTAVVTLIGAVVVLAAVATSQE